MDKRILILLGICSFLAVTTLTIRYIEVEREKIKAIFPDLPKEKKIKTRRNTTSVVFPPEEHVVEERMPVKAKEGKAISLQKEKTIQEKKIAPPHDRTEIKTTAPKAVTRTKKEKESIELDKEEDVLTEEERDTSDKEDVVTPLDEEKDLEEEETASADEEDTDIKKGDSDDDEGGEKITASEDDGIVPEEEFEGAEIEDEEWAPEEEGEMEESEEIVSEEEGIVDQYEEGELIEEEEGDFFEQEEIFIEEE